MESLDFQIEDMWVCEQQQKALHSPMMQAGPLADSGETSLTWFQQHILDYVPLDGPGLRIYRPKSAAADGAPILLYFHGGGGAIGDLESHDAVCRTLANSSAAITVAVDYRLGPEHRFPAAWRDAWSAWQWALGHAAELGTDAPRIAVAGDSAGGGLAAALAQRAVAAGGPSPCFQLLIYPALMPRATPGVIRR